MKEEKETFLSGLVNALSKLKFRYSIVMMLLACLMTFVFTVLFLPKSKLDAQMWQFISVVEGFFVGVLTTAITFYFSKKSETNEENKQISIGGGNSQNSILNPNSICPTCGK